MYVRPLSRALAEGVRPISADEMKHVSGGADPVIVHNPNGSTSVNCGGERQTSTQDVAMAAFTGGTVSDYPMPGWTTGCDG